MSTKFDIEKAPRAFRTISEVASELDLQPYVIRFWESQFKQIKPMRRKGGRRYYRPRDIDFIRGLKNLLHGENLTIKKVKETIIKNGKQFVIAGKDENSIEPLTIVKRKIQVQFSHTGRQSIYCKSLINKQLRSQIYSLIGSLNRLKEQMIARVNT